MSQSELIHVVIIGGSALMAMIVGAGLLTRRDKRSKRPEPWIGYTYSSKNAPEPGRRFIVKSVQDGYVVLEELEEK